MNNKMEFLDAESLLDSLLDDYTSTKQSQILQLRKNNIDKDTFMQDVEQHIKRYYFAEEQVAEAAKNLFEQFVFGYFRLTPLIEDKTISDIKCLSYDNIRVKKNGVRMSSGVSFKSKKEYENFIRYVATRNQVNISSLNSIQRFTDNDSSADFILRFTLSMPLVNTYDLPYLCIRKVPKNFPELKDLIKAGMLSEDLAKILTERFRNGSTVICGSNSSGKTTILNALKETLPETMSILVAQQADELTTKKHPDMLFLHSLPALGESSVSYDLKDISIAGLTMDVDFFIIGEIKGDEAFYLLNAAFTGQICAATIHAPGADKALDKAVDYALQAGKYTKNELMKMLSCFHTVIFMKQYEVNQVYAVNGWDESAQKIDYSVIYERGN